MNEYYISLTRGLLGYYVKVLATSIEVAREYASNYYGSLWCSVYENKDIEAFSSRGWKNIIINDNDPVILDDCPLYE